MRVRSGLRNEYRTRMTQMIQIITDKISGNPANPCNPCAIKNKIYE
jgi:hypothetical protein